MRNTRASKLSLSYSEYKNWNFKKHKNVKSENKNTILLTNQDGSRWRNNLILFKGVPIVVNSRVFWHFGYLRTSWTKRASQFFFAIDLLIDKLSCLKFAIDRKSLKLSILRTARQSFPLRRHWQFALKLDA